MLQKKYLVKKFSGAYLFLLGIFFLASSVCSAQVPAGDFQNLQVLSKDIDRKALIDQMKSFTQALGVRCQHCHVGEEGASLSSFDFASDQKKSKATARTMIRMTEEINRTFLSKLEGKSAQVQCVTCHRGASQPQPLQQVLTAALDKNGIAAAKKKYRELREEYYGSAVFDFRPVTLTQMARKRAVAGHLDEGRELLELNLDYYPQDVSTLLLHGEVLLKGKDPAGAAASFRKVLEVDPDNTMALRRLEEAKK